MRLSEICGIVPVLVPGDHAAGVVGDSINVSKCSHITYLISCATFTDNGGAGADVTVASGASAATQTTNETFYYRIGSAAAGTATADVFSAAIAAATYEMTKATVDSRVMVLEIDVDTVTDAQPWLTLALNNHGTAANCSCIAILSGPRYAEPATAIS